MIATPHKGFTLIETLVAITVLAIALVGPFTAIQNALMSSYTARDQLIASALAQEGLEYIRSIRDNNYLNEERPWMDGLSSLGCYGDAPGSYCVVDPTEGDIHGGEGLTVCPQLSQCAPLQIADSGLYNQSSGEESRFKRVVQIFEISDTEVRVVVEVHWTTSRQNYTITVSDVLRDWI